MRSQVVFSHTSDEWETPHDLFERLDEEFHFTLDGAATTANHKCPRWLGPGGTYPDALTYAPQHEVIWLNPPYSKITQFMGWVEEHSELNKWVLLLPARTDTRWWHRYIWNSENWEDPYSTAEIRFIKGRLKFVGGAASAPFPSVVVIKRP